MLPERLRAASEGREGVWIALLMVVGHPSVRGVISRATGKRADWKSHRLRDLLGESLMLHQGLSSAEHKIACIDQLFCQSTESESYGPTVCGC